MPCLVRRAKSTVMLEAVGSFELSDYIHALSFAPAGDRLAACAASGQVGVWHIPGLARACVTKGHAEGALSLAWEAKGALLATGGEDGVVRVWDPNRGEERAVLLVGASRDWVSHLLWHRESGMLAAAAGKTVRMWTPLANSTFRQSAEIATHKTTVSALVWAPKGAGVISACHGGAWLWKVGKERPVRPFPYGGAPIALAVSPDGRYLASGNLDSSVHLWHIETEQNWGISGYPSKVRMVAFDVPNRYIVTVAGEDLVLWDAKKFEGSSGKLLKGHRGWIQGLACHPQASLVATVGEDGLLHLWEPPSSKPIVAAEVNKAGGLSAVAWDGRGQWLATGASHGTITLFRVDGLRTAA